MSRNALVGILILFVAAFAATVAAFPPPAPEPVPEHSSALDLIRAKAATQ